METIGRKWVFGIGLYLIIKGALNLILGFSMSNLVMLIVSVVALVLMLNRVPYINYIVAVFLALMFLMHVGGNISNLGSQWIYLLEGLLDLGAAAVLVFEKNVKAFFGK
jgi:hypothetical protein|nr:hypothetical protein [uncultured Ruminococcus sp.]